MIKQNSDLNTVNFICRIKVTKLKGLHLIDLHVTSGHFETTETYVGTSLIHHLSNFDELVNSFQILDKYFHNFLCSLQCNTYVCIINISLLLS